MRLPAFFVKLAPIGATLRAIGGEHDRLEAAAAEHNARLAVSQADEAGLSLWEGDYGLSSAGDLSARRSRIRAALTGADRLLTPAALAQLAVTVGGTTAVELEEDFPNARVVLRGTFSDPGGVAALEEAIQRFKPAHLQVQVNPTVELTGTATLYTVLSGGVYAALTGTAET